MNGGRTTQLAGTIPLGGEVGGFAAPPGRPEVITLATEFTLDGSANGGKTWTRDLFAPAGSSWSPVSYLSPDVGWTRGRPAHVRAAPADNRRRRHLAHGQLLSTIAVTSGRARPAAVPAPGSGQVPDAEQRARPATGALGACPGRHGPIGYPPRSRTNTGPGPAGPSG